MHTKQGHRELCAVIMLAAAAFYSLVIMPLTVAAHDLKGVLHDLNSSNVPESVKRFNRAYVTEGDEKTRAVLVNAFIWPIPARLTVCFDNGPVDVRPKIAAAMRHWSVLTQGNLTFIFGEQT